MATYLNPTDAFLQQYPYITSLTFMTPAGIPSKIDFATGTPDAQKVAATAAAQSWDWVPLPMPDLTGFIGAIRTDSTLVPVLADILQLLPLLQVDISNQTLLAYDWAWAVNQYQSDWLTSDIQKTLLTYAAQFHIPLVQGQ